MSRQIGSLILELQRTPPASACIVVHPDRQSPIARPADRNQNWLDVRAGDEVYLKGRRNRVAEVRLYRGSDGGRTVNHESVITCGRDWLNE